MGLLIGLLIVNLLLSCVVGWASNQRGRSFWLGFWLSAFLSPILGVLILIALPGGSGASPKNSVAASEWLKVRNSLDGRDYDDFIQVLPGTAEAVLATQHKRLLQDWQAIDNLDGHAVGAFMQRSMFPALTDEIRKVVERNAANSSTCFELLERIKAKEQRLKDEEAERRAAEAERLKNEQARSHEASKVFYGLFAAALAAFAIVPLVLWWSDQRACADREMAVSSAEAREQVENAELRRRIQKLNAAIADNSTSSAAASELRGELSELQDMLINSRSYQDLDAARETFYACERAVEEGSD